MSISGVFSLSLFDSNNTSATQSTFQNDFKKLGSDLQSGNLTAAQSDFATRSQIGQQSRSSQQQTNPIKQAFDQLAKDLASGNLSAAQQDFNTLQQDVQNQAQSHSVFHHGGNGSSGGSSSSTGSFSQLFSQLGQALRAGNLSSAQQAFAALQQNLEKIIKNPPLQLTHGLSVSA